MDKKVQEYITKFLKIIGDYIPMHPAKPNFTLNEDGTLQLGVIINHMWYTWYFDEEEEMSPEELAEFIVSEFRKDGLIA